MDLDIQFAPDRHLVSMTVCGPCDAQALAAASAQLRSDPRWAPDLDRLWDFQAATVDLSGTDIRRMAAELGLRRDSAIPYRLAIVVGGTLAYGLGRMLQTHLELAERPIVFGLFKTLDEAWAWLGVADAGHPDVVAG
jgi:hypothetical protein